MTTPQPKPKRRRWWTWLTQFSLRTLLVVVTLVGVACWWFLTPEAREEDLAGKHLTLWRQVRVKEAPEGMLPRTDADDERWLVSHGAWRVRDRHGDLLIDGRYSGDEPHGKWTVYHVNGHKAAEGWAFRGVRAGTWRTWDEAGTLRSEVTYKAVRQSNRPIPAPQPATSPFVPLLGMIDLPLAQFGSGMVGGGGPLPLPFWQPGFESIRHGPAKRWYASSQLHFEGAYRDDQRDGPWTFYDEQGRVTAQGVYRAGVREDKWQVAEPPAPQLSREYAAGMPADELERLLSTLGRQLAAEGGHRKVAAARRLEQLGPPAVPCLVEALDSADPEVQLLALRALTRQNILPESAQPKFAALVRHPDSRLALRARLALYLAAPQRRAALFGELLKSVDLAGDELAFEALLAMYRADADRRLAILAPLVERLGRAAAAADQSSIGIQVDPIADLGWDVVPHLAAIYPQASDEARWCSVLVLTELVRRDLLANSAANAAQDAWKPPESAQPLLSQALSDPDPRVKELATLVAEGRVFGGDNSGGFGGQAGGFF